MSFRRTENPEPEKNGADLALEVIAKTAEIHKEEIERTGRARKDHFTAEDHPRYQRIFGKGKKK